jgi:hypothetical protein
MAIWSEVPFSLAWNEQRFGSEFWMPQYLEPLEEDRNWTPIGEALLRAQYGISQEMNEEGIGIPIYRMNEMDGLFLSIPSKSVEVPEKEYNEFRLSVGDVLFNRTNSYKYVGRTGILKDVVNAVFASYLIRLVPDTKRLLPEYLTVYLNSPTGISQVKRRAMESINQTNVSGSEIKRVPIPLFPLAFQRRIAALVDKAAQIRRQSLKDCEEADNLLSHELGFDKIDLSHELNYEGNFSEVQEAERYDAEYFQPKYYRVLKAIEGLKIKRVIPLEQLLKSVTNGHTPLRHNLGEGEIPFLTAEHIFDFRIDYSSEKRILREHHENELKRTQLKESDLLITIKGRIGNAAVVERLPGQVNINQDVALLRLTPLYHAYYVTGFLNSIAGKALVAQISTGQINPFIGLGNLRRVPIPIFEKERMDELGEHVKNKVNEARRASEDAQQLLEEAKRRVEKMILGEK